MNGAGIRLELLAEAEIDALCSATLERLDRRVAGGVEIALRALDSVLGTWTMAGRAAEGPVFGDGGTLLVAGGLAAATLPAEVGAAARATRAADAERFCLLADALPQASAVEPLPVVAGGIGVESPAAARLEGVATAFAASGKHLLAVAFDDDEARAVVEMATLVAGGAEALRARPLLTLAAPPFAAIAVAGVAADAGVPCLVSLSRVFTASGVPDEGSREGASGNDVAADTADADIGDGLADSLAAGLAAAAEVLGRVPGAALGFALPPFPRPQLDERRLVVLAALAQLSHSFGLPLLATALATQAPAPGWLASAENTAAAMTSWLAGVDGLAGAGLLACGDAASLVELALDAEIASYAAATSAGVPVDNETLAVETIQKVGIAGNYLGERHTRRHMRDVWRPRFYDRTPYEQWLRQGRRQSVDLAGDFVQHTLAEHAPPPLDLGCAEELSRIVQEIGRENQ